MTPFQRKIFNKGLDAANRCEHRTSCPFVTPMLIKQWEAGFDSAPPKEFSVSVHHTNDTVETVQFMSHHSATRFFSSFVGDCGITAVYLTTVDALELGKWLNPYA